jgi:ABC-2 type transport system ATP-binding protein/lipopolysaccharide transport system ATP-binding protein
MKPGNVIEVQGLSMCYRTHKSKRRTLRESAFRTLLRRDELVEVWGLRDVSFELARGEALGLIGSNGAGKSTMCLILSKIMTPTAGTVEVSGKVSALLALGAGFDTDLTGLDNITLNAVYMGYRLDEVRELYNDIVEFSGLGDAVRMPVRTYSAGMRARLAFSIAQSVRPEILIIDELMGVGDRKFMDKSTARMHEMVNQCEALVVVSHNMETIRSLCSRVVWLEQGQLVAAGPTDEVIAQYEAE